MTPQRTTVVVVRRSKEKIDVLSNTMHIENLVIEFLHYNQFIRGRSPASIKRYKENLSYFLRYTKISSLSEITHSLVLSFFIHGRAERNWSPATFHTYLMSLHVFFRWCVAKGHIEKDFTEDIEKPRIPKSLPKALSKEDAEKLLEMVYNYPYPNPFLRYRNHAIFATFIFTGLRRNELLNLKFTDVDIENKTLFVSYGKGSKDRIIPLSCTLVFILQKYLDLRKKNLYTCAEFFVSSKANKGFTEHGLKHFVKHLKRISPVHFTLHALRHTFATLMLEGGCDIYSLSKMLGHSDIKTTTVYLSASAKHLRSQVVKHPLNHNYNNPTGLSYNLPS
ncbi:MAG: tyrosine-type recombinase/integrase [Flavobacteriaceae bacterium]